jgi:SnoaL-like domain
MTIEEMQEKLTWLLDRQEIVDVLTTYTRAVDRHDEDLLYRAYHEDMIDDHGAFVGNREEFVDWAFNMQREHHAVTQHFITNHTIDIDGDVAHSEAYFLWIAVNRTGVPFTQVGGRYIDRLEKRDGHWYILARNVVTDWVMPTVNTREAVESGAAAANFDYRGPREYALIATRPGPHRDRNDISYARPLTIDQSRLETYRSFTEETPAAAR